MLIFVFTLCEYYLVMGAFWCFIFWISRIDDFSSDIQCLMIARGLISDQVYVMIVHYLCASLVCFVLFRHQVRPDLVRNIFLSVCCFSVPLCTNYYTYYSLWCVLSINGRSCLELGLVTVSHSECRCSTVLCCSAISLFSLCSRVLLRNWYAWEIVSIIYYCSILCRFCRIKWLVYT